MAERPNILHPSSQQIPDTPDPVRRPGLFWTYAGPIVILLVAVAIAWVYWARHDGVDPRPTTEPATMGTSGDATPGGGDPAAQPGGTSDELEQRGATPAGR